MPNRMPLRNVPLSDQVLAILIERIRSGVYAPNSQLPPENGLAAELGVSRATIRSALGSLASRSLVVRRQGVGTFVSRLSSISNPLNEIIDFLELIASSGLEPGLIQISATEIQADSDLAELFRIEPESKVLRVRKLFTADGEAVIYCINRIPAWVYHDCLTPEEAVQPGITEPIFEFLEHQCGQRIEYYIATVRAEIVKNCDMQELPVHFDPLTPVLVIDEIGYNSDERPVHQSIEYHPANWMNFELIRGRGLLSGR
mgnify:CR=1 FL=1